MGLLDGLEKLINEHGSAVILKERISLANDKYALIEEKLNVLQIEKSKLESEKISLQRENEELKIRIKVIEDHLENESKKYSQLSLPNVSEIQEKILVLLANKSNLTDRQIALAVGVGNEVAKLHLEDLIKSKMIDYSLCINRPTEYYLIQEGRRYLLNKGLIK